MPGEGAGQALFERLGLGRRSKAILGEQANPDSARRTHGPSAWPMPAEEKIVFQNGLHDLQVRKNRASVRNDEADLKAVEAQLKRAEPLLKRFQAELTQGDLMGLHLPAIAAARTQASK